MRDNIANLSIIVMDKSLHFWLINIAQLIEHLPISRNDAGSKPIHWILTAITQKQKKMTHFDSNYAVIIITHAHTHVNL